MATFTLDGWSLPESAREDAWSGIVKEKPRADVKTLGGNISVVWDFSIADVKVVHLWDWMYEDDFNTLKTKYESSPAATYVYTVSAPYTTGTYVVEITRLEGVPFQDYFHDVELELKILQEV